MGVASWAQGRGPMTRRILGVLVGRAILDRVTAISGDAAAIAGYGETSVIETEHALCDGRSAAATSDHGDLGAG